MNTWISKLRLAACLAAPGLATSAFAQNAYYPNPQCAAPQYCAPNCYRPSATPQGEPTAPPGMFVAPPASGEVQGESNSLGVHGPALRIPESIIRLPTLQMPSLVKYRRNPEMLTDNARATYQAEPASARLQFARPQAAPANANPQGEPTQPNCNQPVMVPCAPWCAQNGAPANDEVARLQQQVSQLTAVVGQLAALQQQQATTAVQPVTFQNPPVRPTAYEAPRSGPSPAELQAQAQYEQKCRELTELQNQLSAVQWEYQALLEAKQQQLALQRDARMRRQLEEPAAAPSMRTDTPVQPVTHPSGALAPARVAPAPDERAPVVPAGRAPLRLRGRAANATPEETLYDQRMPQASTGNSGIQRVSAEEEVAVEDEVPAVESPAAETPTGIRLGRWFKRSR